MGEIAIDANGECLEEIVRIRISVDVTKQLKKILFFEENGEKIPMLVQYERLPYFYFCCSYIGHQYRECVVYKGQLKEKLAFKEWLKTTS